MSIDGHENFFDIRAALFSKLTRAIAETSIKTKTPSNWFYRLLKLVISGIRILQSSL